MKTGRFFCVLIMILININVIFSQVQINEKGVYFFEIRSDNNIKKLDINVIEHKNENTNLPFKIITNGNFSERDFNVVFFEGSEECIYYIFNRKTPYEFQVFSDNVFDDNHIKFLEKNKIMLFKKGYLIETTPIFISIDKSGRLLKLPEENNDNSSQKQGVNERNYYLRNNTLYYSDGNDYKAVLKKVTDYGFQGNVKGYLKKENLLYVLAANSIIYILNIFESEALLNKIKCNVGDQEIKSIIDIYNDSIILQCENNKRNSFTIINGPKARSFEITEDSLVRSVKLFNGRLFFIESMDNKDTLRMINLKKQVLNCENILESEEYPIQDFSIIDNVLVMNFDYPEKP